MKTNSLDDRLLLQSDPDRFFRCGETLGLALNIVKCRSMSFIKGRSPIVFTYTMINNLTPLI